MSDQWAGVCPCCNGSGEHGAGAECQCCDGSGVFDAADAEQECTCAMDKGVTADLEKVGPHGYIHGWKFVGVPGVGMAVHHPRHGAGKVERLDEHGHVHVRFDSGARRSFSTTAADEHGPRLARRDGTSELDQHMRAATSARRRKDYDAAAMHHQAAADAAQASGAHPRIVADLRERTIEDRSHTERTSANIPGVTELSNAAPPRTFRAQEVAALLGNHTRTTDEHRRVLEDAGATPEQSEAILRGLGADTSQGHLHPSISTALFRSAQDEKEAQARAEKADYMRGQTPHAYASLLGTGPIALTHPPTRATFEAMQAHGWTLTDVGPGMSAWASADGERTLRMLTGHGDPTLYDGGSGKKLSGKAALELAMGGKPAVPAHEEMTESIPRPRVPDAVEHVSAPASPLERFSPHEQAVIRNAVADHAGRFHENAAIRGSEARYVAEGPLSRLTNERGLRDVADAARHVINEDPSVLQRSAAERASGIADRAARQERLVNDAVEASGRGEHDEVDRLISEAESIDPTYQPGATATYPGMTFDQLRAGAAHDRAQSSTTATPASGESARTSANIPSMTNEPRKIGRGMTATGTPSHVGGRLNSGHALEMDITEPGRGRAYVHDPAEGGTRSIPVSQDKAGKWSAHEVNTDLSGSVEGAKSPQDLMHGLAEYFSLRGTAKISDETEGRKSHSGTFDVNGQPAQRPRRTDIILPDGTMATRKSGTKEYTHAVVQTRRNHELAAHREAQAAQIEAATDKFEALRASGADVEAHMRRIDRFANQRTTAREYVREFESHPGVHFPDRAASEREARYRASLPGSGPIASGAEIQRSVYGTNDPGTIYQRNVDEAIKQRREQARMLRDEAAKLRQKPPVQYDVTRWSESERAARNALKDPYVVQTSPGHSGQVVEVGTDMRSAAEARAAAPTAGPSEMAKSVTEHLAQAKTRDEARAYLTRLALTKAELHALTEQHRLAVPKSASGAEHARVLVESLVGTRLDHEAIMRRTSAGRA